ncbi:MAG: outer membrane lipoprotein carrier protein LolA, partial [Pseudomonadota bacterium]
ENPSLVPQSVSISVDIDENLGTEELIVDSEEPGLENGSADPIQPVFADLSDQEVFEKAKAYFGDLSTLTADFVQVAPSGGVSSGRLWLRRPRQLRMEYGEERDPQLLIVATQGNVFVRDNDLETTDQYPIKSTPLGLILSKEGVSPSVEIVRVTRSENRVDVTVRDQDKDAEGELTLSLAAPDLALREWAVLDPQGGVTVVALENIIEGQSIANRLFRAPEAGGKFLNR